MNKITLTEAEAIILHDILVKLHDELSWSIGQDMTAVLDSEEVAAAASEFNYDDVEVVDENGNYNLFAAVSHFLERLQTEE